MKARVFTLVALVFSLVALGCSGGGEHGQAPVAHSAPETGHAQEIEPAPHASARIEPKSGSSLTGTATFTSSGGMVTLDLEVHGAPPGELAVHLHEIGDCSAADGSSAGPHWNPAGSEHGRWGASPFHLGDVGNLRVGPDGTGRMTLSTDLWKIGGGDPGSDIVGRAVVVHEKADDFVTQPTGAAGGRIGCGVIE